MLGGERGQVLLRLLLLQRTNSQLRWKVIVMLLNLGCDVGGAVDDGRGAQIGSCTCAIFLSRQCQFVGQCKQAGTGTMSTELSAACAVRTVLSTPWS